MMPGINPQHPDITDDMWTQVNQIIEEEKSTPGSLITVLRKCQNVVGYLPTELLEYISYGLNLSRGEVFGVATFYSYFSLTPKGRHTVKMCLGTACYVKGIKEVVDRVSNQYNVKEGETTDDRRFSLEGVRCLGACGLAPVMVVNEDTHGDVKADKVINILEDYK